MGVPSVIISPKDEYMLSEEDADQIQRTYMRKVGGSQKGSPLILSGSMSVETLSFSPKDLDIGTLRNVPESRISAVLGVPAMLLDQWYAARSQEGTTNSKASGIYLFSCQEECCR